MWHMAQAGRGMGRMALSMVRRWGRRGQGLLRAEATANQHASVCVFAHVNKPACGQPV